MHLEDRVVEVIARIRELPDGDADFAKEIALLGQVSAVMKDAADILAGPKPGRRRLPLKPTRSSCS